MPKKICDNILEAIGHTPMVRINAITRGLIDTGHTIRVPVHRVESRNKVLQTARQMQTKLGRDPKPEELAKEMRLSIQDLLKLVQTHGEPVSLQTPIWEDGDRLEFERDDGCAAVDA